MTIERIKEINHLSQDGERWREYEGYEIVTNKQKIVIAIEKKSKYCTFGYFWAKENLNDFLNTEFKTIDIIWANNQAIERVNVKLEGESGIKPRYNNVRIINLHTGKGLLQFILYHYNAVYDDVHKIKIECNYVCIEEEL